jgi:hypothetical protein
MWRTEIVQTTNQKQALFERGQGTRQGATTASQASQRLTEGGIQPFKAGGVDAAAAFRRGLNDRLNQRGIALFHAAFNLQVTGGASFDNLDQAQVGPSNLTGRTALTGTQRGAKRALNNPDLSDQTIHRPNHRATQRDLDHLGHESCQQVFVTRRADRAAQPPARRNPDRQRHPNHSGVRLHLDFIRLYLPQVHLALTDDMFMHLLTVFACPPLPIGHRALIQAKRCDNRLNWTAVTQQGYHAHTVLLRFLDPLQGGTILSLNVLLHVVQR